MMPSMPLRLMTAFIVKHFVCDFPITMQTPWMFLNKGKYGHPGGIVHALIHVIFSLFFLMFYAFLYPLALKTMFGLVAFEFLVHYHMDWFKVWYGKRKGWTPQTPQFWTFLGIDQMVHYLTYIIMIGWLI